MTCRFTSRSSKLQLSRRNSSRNARLFGEAQEPVVLHLVEFEITEEPIHDRRLLRLSRRDQERIDAVRDKIMEGAEDQAPATEELIEEFPDIPCLYNFLSIAYQNARNWEKTIEWIERTYRRFPDYLFGVVNYANHLLRAGRVDEVTAILKNRFGLHQWIPWRRRYHISEFVSFHAMMVMYFSAVGEKESAESYLDMLHEVAPDAPATRAAVEFTSVSFVGRALRSWRSKYQSRQRRRVEAKAVAAPHG